MRIRDTLLNLLDSALDRPTRAKTTAPSILYTPSDTMRNTAVRVASRQAEQAAAEARLAEMITTFDRAAGKPGAAETLLAGAAAAEADRLSKVTRKTRIGTGTYCPHQQDVARLREHGLSTPAAIAALRAGMGEMTFERGTLPPTAAKPTPAATAPVIAWTLPTLAELVDATFGRGVSASVCRRATMIDLAGRAEFFENVTDFQRPGREDEWDRLQDAKAQAAKPAQDREDFDKLRALCLSFGLRVPGLSFSGLRLPRAEGDSRARQIAQANADAFCAVLMGDEVAQVATTPAAESGRRLLAASHGKRFCVGMKLETR